MMLERAERIQFESPVQLLSTDERYTVAGFTANLSESGLFVTAPCPFEIGDHVLCELPVEGSRLRLRGKVAWVQQLPGDDGGPTTGMGIHFVDPSATDVAALRQFMGKHDLNPTSVTVLFDGFARPIRARARVTDRGLQLWTSLPFLRLRSSVNVAFGDADAPPGRRGVLKQVGLDLVQGVPRLQIDVGLDDQARSQQWQPGQVIYSSAPEPEARPELEIVEVVDERSTLVDARPLCVDAAAADVASGIIDLPTSGRVVEVVAVDEDSDDVDYELEVQRGLAEIDPAAESHWSLGQPQAGAEAPYDRFWRESERRRHRLWLWIAAVLMGSVAVASMVQTEFWQRVSERLWPPPSTGQLAAAQLPEALRDDSPVAPTAAPVAPPLQPDAVDRGPGAPPEAPTAPPASQGETPAAAKQALIAVEREGGAVVLRLGLRGSATEARHYELADPDGLAINLPHARPAGAFGHYPINRGGIRTVWVRERLGGMQVRVFFDRTEAEQQPRLRIDEHQIEVRLGNGS